MAKPNRRPLTGMGADAFFGTEDHVKEEKPLDSQKVAPSHSDTVETLHREEVEEAESQVVKTSFYPKPAQLDKLDDLAAEFNHRYRRKRARINRNHIVRFLIDLVDIDMLEDLNPKS